MKTVNALLVILLFSVPALQEAAASEQESFSQAELDQMLAPVALYPDTVLSHILIAATYPLEVVQAARWVQENPGMNGEAAVAAVEDRGWDPSVKALVAFPDLLRRMNDDLEWTQRLGEAFMVQEEDVVTSVQGLRERAYAAGNLRSNEQVQVVREREVIYVEPARPNIVYVPYYDPRVVYGTWWWPGYQPVYWQRPVGYTVGVSYHWGHGYRIMPSWFYISSFHWTRRQVVVVHHHHYHNRQRPVFHSSRAVVRYGGSNHWQHNTRHRRGVAYRTPRLSEQYGWTSTGAQRPHRSSVDRTRTSSNQRDWAANRRETLTFDATAERARMARGQRPGGMSPQRQDRVRPDGQAARITPAPTQRAEPTFRRGTESRAPSRPQVQRSAPVQRQAPTQVQHSAPVQRQAPTQVQRSAPVQRQAPRQAPRRDTDNGVRQERQRER